MVTHGALASTRFTGYLDRSGAVARGEGGLWVLMEAMTARLFESSLAGEMTEGLWPGKERS